MSSDSSSSPRRDTEGQFHLLSRQLTARSGCPMRCFGKVCLIDSLPQKPRRLSREHLSMRAKHGGRSFGCHGHGSSATQYANSAPKAPQNSETKLSTPNSALRRHTSNSAPQTRHQEDTSQTQNPKLGTYKHLNQTSRPTSQVVKHQPSGLALASSSGIVFLSSLFRPLVLSSCRPLAWSWCRPGVVL